jgi:hypothetical protein
VSFLESSVVRGGRRGRLSDDRRGESEERYGETSEEHGGKCLSEAGKEWREREKEAERDGGKRSKSVSNGSSFYRCAR